MRIVPLLLGLLVLKRLPFGFVARWSIRLGILGGLAYAAIRTLKPDMLSSASRRTPPVPSGWTAQPAPPSGATPAESGHAEVVVDETLVTGEEGSAVVETTIQAAETTTGADSEPALAGDEDATHSAEPERFPSWVQGDGSHECPEGFPVKAKATSLIYHTTESINYPVTIPDVCFASAEDAELAGYRAPLR